MTKRGPETRNLQCKLSKDEWEQRATSFANAHERIAVIEQKQKSANADFKGQIDGERASARALQRAVIAGSEPRDVRCVWEYDYEHGRRYLVREDTGEHVEEATLTAEELQTEIDFDGAEPTAEELADESRLS